MSFELVYTLVVALATIALFVSERFPLALVAMLSLSALMVGGVITVEQAFSGFSNVATMTVAALFVVSAGVFRAGALNAIGTRLGRTLERSYTRGLAALCAGAAVLSAFVNNTAVVAILLPIVIRTVRGVGLSPSKVLIPLSFAAMLGGVCTLIGTSTNLLVDAAVRAHGLEPLGIFEFTPLGLVFLGAGLVYLVFLAPRLLPARRDTGDANDARESSDYVIDVTLKGGAPSLGRRLQDAPLLEDIDCDVLWLKRVGSGYQAPRRALTLKEGDVLRMRCSLSAIPRLLEKESVQIVTSPSDRRGPVPEDSVLVEAVVAPNTDIEGQELDALRLPEIYGTVVLAVRHRGELRRRGLRHIRLRAGDVLLLRVPRDRLEELAHGSEFVLVSEVPLPSFRKQKMPLALAIAAGVVVVAAIGILPIVVTAVLGAVLMMLTGCLRHTEAIDAIDWNIVFLLAGIIPLGVAMETSGAARLLATLLVNAVGVLGPVALVAAIYASTTLLTEVISNNGTAVLLTPIAIAVAEQVGASPRPFVMAVAFGASMALLSPIGYQTNTLVYGAGHYRFTDFARVGAALSVLLLVLASLLIPVVWPL